MNIVDPILFQCRLNAPAPAICAPGTPLNILSYGRLERFIHNISHKAIAAGLMAGQTVAVMVQDKLFHAALTLAFIRLGVVTISARTPSLPAELSVDALIADAAVRSENVKRLIVADSRCRRRCRDRGERRRGGRRLGLRADRRGGESITDRRALRITQIVEIAFDTEDAYRSEFHNGLVIDRVGLNFRF
jgi:hypothetical protein